MQKMGRGVSVFQGFKHDFSLGIRKLQTNGGGCKVTLLVRGQGHHKKIHIMAAMKRVGETQAGKEGKY